MTPEEFRAALKDLGMSQIFLALNAKMSPTTVNRWATGLQPIPGWVPWVFRLLEESRTNRARLAAYDTLLAAPRETRHPEDDTRRRSDAP